MIKEIELEEKIHIIQIYAPIEGAELEEITKFYIELQENLDQIRERSDKIVIMRDWNARVGNHISQGLGCMRQYGEKTRNNIGDLMIEFCQTNDLLIGNSFWYQEENERYTFVAIERNARSIIDYLVYTKEVQNMIGEIKTNKEAELSTQHRLVTAELTQRKECRVKKKVFRTIQSHRLKNEEIRENYLEKTEKEWTLEKRWQKLKQLLITRATEICKTRKIGIQQANRTRWWNDRVKNEVKEKKTLWKRYIKSKSEVDKQNYIEQRNKVKKIIKEEKKKSWTKFGDFVTEEYTKNKKHFWNIVKNLKNKNEKVIRGVRDQNNTLETNIKDISRVWAEYYKIKFETKENDPLEETTEGETTEETDEDIIMEELEEAI